jgi:hypothetical protein
MSSLSFRAKGLVQFAYEALHVAHARLTLRDLAASFRPIVVDCVICGHVDVRMFYCADDENPLAEKGHALNDDAAILRAAQRAAVRFAVTGRRRGGYLSSFALANAEHLTVCVRCQRTVCASIREENRSRRLIWGWFAAEAEQIDPEYFRSRLPPEMQRYLRDR